MPQTTRWCHDAGSHGCAAQLARVQGQQRLAAIQRLDLRLLIDAQDKGFVWRTQIEPDNVSDFLNEQRIGRQLERLRAMRLQPEGSPNPTDGALAQAGSRRHRPTTPMRGIQRSCLQGPGHHVLDVRIGNPPRRAGSGLVQQAIQPLLQETLPPLADHLRRHPLLLRHHMVQLPGRAAQDQPSPLGQSLRCRATTRRSENGFSSRRAMMRMSWSNGFNRPRPGW